MLRPFNTYGPRQSARAVIPTIISQIASGAKTIKLGSLTPTRDFNYVQDTCDAFVAVGNSDQALGKIINSASRFEISIGQTAEIIATMMKADIEIITEAERLRPENSEVNRLFGDNTLLKSITNWEPNYGGREGFRKGLGITIDWFLDPQNLKNYRADEYVI